MLSILIPIYNFKVVKLVNALRKQCERQKIVYEILCYDDRSKPKIKHENSLLSSYFGVNYTELSENLGRARIRNWLSKTAAFDNLLFLDCDSKIIKKDFISTYVKHLNDYELISGGRVYSKKPPRAKSKKLHWLYGLKKESKKSKFRNKHPIQFFHSNNFLVKRDIAVKYRFNEKIEGYGYEDLMWAQTLFEKGITIKHIDNEVEHLGLEKADVFLDKTKEAIKNLKRLNTQGHKISTRLIEFDLMLGRFKLKNLLLNYIKNNIEKITSNLLSKNPKLYNLDLFKFLFYNNM